VFESERDLLIVVALPGVDAQDIEISSQAGVLLVAGVRRLPAAVRGTEIVRLEIPQGRFERRIRLPAARWELNRSSLVNGCLVINLTKPMRSPWLSRQNHRRSGRASSISRFPRMP
jgi:HSP20 family molecular chaperone IbpA